MNYFKAEQKVIKKMSNNGTIPSEAFQTLVEEEFFGKDIDRQVDDLPFRVPEYKGKINFNRGFDCIAECEIGRAHV